MSEDNPIYKKDPRFGPNNGLLSSNPTNQLLDVDKDINIHMPQSCMTVKYTDTSGHTIQPKSPKLIFIDLDGTLIRQKSGAMFPAWIGDLEIIDDTLLALLYAKPKYVVIVSNQGGIEHNIVNLEAFESKINYIANAIEDNFRMNKYEVKTFAMFCASNDKENPYRKPNTGMLQMAIDKLKEINGEVFEKSEMLMVGDASGLLGSFSNSDAKTAENFEIDYMDVKDFQEYYNKLNGFLT